MRGAFITFEGPEGSGKSTQAALLVDCLRESGRTVISVREPGGTATGEAIRDILQHDSAGESIFPETETLLFEACRAQLVRQTILPALERGDCVVSDRFADSTTAYQGYGRGFEVARIVDINAFAVNGAVPDLTVLLDLPVDEGFRRICARNQATGKVLDRMELEGLEFHERVRRGYLEMARLSPERFRIIRGDQPPAGVSAKVWQTVGKWLAGRC